MLGVGWTEMLVIGIVALIVIGPKELPSMMRRVGQFAGTVRRMGQEFQRELNKTTGLNEIANLRNSVTQPLKATADAIRKEFNTTTETGEVKPSGAIKPADPKVESVVDEIKAAAGMTAAVAAPAAAAPAPAAAAPEVAAKPAVKAARPARIKAPKESTVEAADLTPLNAPAPRTRKAPASPAAAAPKPSARKTAAAKPKTPATKVPAAAETAATKPAARKAAAKAAKPMAAEAEEAVAKPAARKSGGKAAASRKTA